MTDEPVYATFGFSDAEWGLLVGLPQSVLTAASAADPDSARKTRAENAAGLDTIAAGRESASPLVAAVAGELVPGSATRSAARSCRPSSRPTRWLRRRRRSAGPARRPRCWPAGREGDAGAYKHWLVEIAERWWRRVARRGAGHRRRDGHRDRGAFRDDLAKALSD